MRNYDTVIIGAGAAGLMAAGEIKGRVLVLDHNVRPGRKLLVSGGGKCNFSNAEIADKFYFSQNPHFVKSALAGFKTQDFLDILTKYHMKWEVREDGKLFGDNAKDILDALEMRAQENGAEFQYGFKVYDVEPQENGTYQIQIAREKISAANVIIATGGLSMPKTGATSFAFDLASKLGLKLTERYPALTPFLFTKEDAEKFGPLTGISLRATLSHNKKSVTDDMLFTHYGISGPAVLKMSLFYTGGEEMTINFLPSVDVRAAIENARKTNKNFHQVLSEVLPPRLVKTLLPDMAISVANATKVKIEEIIKILTAYPVTPLKNTSYLKAEITGGGVDTAELSSSTMECRRFPGLYFVGECMDVSGSLGGYNLHWAWASAHAAAKAINKKTAS
ncbi:hypothetical protein Dip510_001489 [Elusimicrobium posterum]|uniref:NAD(P)/FAD-dependent oxidoreductase n=1 Tax=Elusimicrobium posterum TaxID=3116653 RepID=UPI003C71C920